jgi:hypothetical protein
MTPKLIAKKSEALDRGNGPLLIEHDQTNRKYNLVGVGLDELDACVRVRLATVDP